MQRPTRIRVLILACLALVVFHAIFTDIVPVFLRCAVSRFTVRNLRRETIVHDRVNRGSTEDKVHMRVIGTAAPDFITQTVIQEARKPLKLDGYLFMVIALFNGIVYS